jgi:hypothetical protein
VLHFNHAEFVYEPYPLGIIASVFKPETYDALSRQFPSLDLFKHKPELGNKYSLSELNNPEKYEQFLAENEAWGGFHRYIKSKEFVDETLAALKSRHIDLNLGKYAVIPRKNGAPPSPDNLLHQVTELSARFEFSVLSGQGGHVRPHTDAPQKIITYVFSMIREGEWDPAWGGSTAIVWPKDKTRTFNQANKMIALADVDFIKELPFNPNQAIVFIKTFNSWHAVAPITSPSNEALRKTVTVVIERRN